MDPSATPPLLPEARILIVDDDANVLLAMSRALKLKGYSYVDEAHSGLEAVEKLTRMPYDLMMLDIRMPDMDGMAVLQKAQQLRPNLLVIILTGHAAMESALTSLKSGMVVDYLLKPASLDQVEAAVRKALRKRLSEMQQRHSLETAIAALEQLKTDAPVPQGGAIPLALERFLYAGPVSLDRDNRQAILKWEGKIHTAILTASEENILALLMSRPGDVFSSRRIAREALNYELSENEAKSIVHPHIVRLRRKIEQDSKHPGLIRTVRGKGYTMSLEESPEKFPPQA
ncbi:MAG: response regulator transcription factor [Anaerolineales bacterium]|nr:response regulator transcription factor [Anaerolineales bacterium]